ncbi:MAG: polymerase subunit gamma and tau [Frankiales bacterium]|nr:polymerase subunit gamma and tau [Frankiales bacterium]
MSLALYRKYRPGSFAEVKGQDHVTGPLQQALRNGRVHHAYLFSGPRGCGKTSSARILARSLNCEKGPTPDPCGQCDSCIALAPNGPGSLDVVEIDAASHGGVDDARDLRERAFYAPISSQFKIYIIDEAHMVSREGFNALLKLVEEPPDFLRFVFATTEPEKVLATIRSRTHHYPFRLMPRRELTDLLTSVVESEGIHVDPTVLPLVVRAAAGSARDGLSILDQVLASAGADGVTREAAAALLGVTPDTLLDDVIDAFAARDGAGVFATVDRVMENGHDPRRFAADVLERLRDLVVLDAIPDAGDKGLLDVPPDQLVAMSRQATNLGTAGLSRAADLFHDGLTEMRGTTSPRLLLELVCARVLLPAASSDDAAVLTRLERIERRLEIVGGPAPAAPASAAPATPAPPRSDDPRTGTPPATAAGGGAGSVKPQRPTAPAAPAVPAVPAAQAWPTAAVPGAAGSSAPSPEPVEQGTVGQGTVDQGTASGGMDATALRRSWDAVLDAASERKRATKALLLNAQVSELNGRLLTLAFSTAALARQFQTSTNIDVLKESLQAVLGLDVDLTLVVAGDVPASSPLPAPASAATPPAPAPTYDGFAPGDEIEPEDPDAPQPERQVAGEDAALKLVADQLGGTVVGTVEP